ncbi:hemin uptake protein HemP [Kluyvera sp. NPDC087067]|uniref:hemin uptake protein HemP n=1 Tax=unclassified Kluyvera TaxID=2619995 RepID=UPI00141271B4
MASDDNMHESPAAIKKENAPLSPSRSKPMIKSKALLGEEGWVLIEHNDQHYLLRQTQSGKLILTK